MYSSLQPASDPTFGSTCLPTCDRMTEPNLDPVEQLLCLEKFHEFVEAAATFMSTHPWRQRDQLGRIFNLLQWCSTRPWMDVVVPQYNDFLGVLLNHMVSSRTHLVSPC